MFFLKMSFLNFLIKIGQEKLKLKFKKTLLICSILINYPLFITIKKKYKTFLLYCSLA